jgi:hypothetical protein
VLWTTGTSLWGYPLQCAPIVPILLDDVAVVVEGAAVRLSWTLALDDDVVGYYLRRSGDGADFERLHEAMLPIDDGPTTYLDRTVQPRHTYAYELELVTAAGWSSFLTLGRGVVVNGVSSVPFFAGVGANPLDRTTRFEITLPSPMPAHVAVYDAAGRQHRTLVHGLQPAGQQVLVWDACDARGDRVPSGVYFVRMRAGDRDMTVSVAVAR